MKSIKELFKNHLKIVIMCFVGFFIVGAVLLIEVMLYDGNEGNAANQEISTIAIQSSRGNAEDYNDHHDHNCEDEHCTH